MKTALQNIKGFFADSPLIGLSLITCCWSYLRALLYQQKITSLPLDLPLISASRTATEMNMTVTLTLVALIGVGAVLLALHRDKEEAWYIGLVTIFINIVAWWYALSQLNWGPVYES